MTLVNVQRLRKHSRLLCFCTNCCHPCTLGRNWTSCQHLAAQRGTGASLETPQILNMVLRTVQALITYHSLAAGDDSLSYLVHHILTSAELQGSCTFIFFSCLFSFLLIPLLLTAPLLPQSPPFSVPPAPVCCVEEMICKITASLCASNCGDARPLTDTA